MKNYLTVLMALFCFNLVGQCIVKNRLEGFWVQLRTDSVNTDEVIYKHYSAKISTMLWTYQNTQQVEYYSSNFGFYHDCDLPSIKSLKQNGTYYFEVDSTDFVDEKARMAAVENGCAQMNIQIQGKDTLMSIYYSSRQQFVKYKKIQALPPNVQEYLKNKGIDLK